MLFGFLGPTLFSNEMKDFSLELPYRDKIVFPLMETINLPNHFWILDVSIVGRAITDKLSRRGCKVGQQHIVI